MKAEGVDDLSRSASRARRLGASESTAALRRIVTSEAEEILSLDLFATADSTLVPRFFTLYPRSRSPRVSTPSLSRTGAGLAANTAASSVASVHSHSRREAC
jgi:hypothetical protein